jgi:hypothetical protein
MREAAGQFPRHPGIERCNGAVATFQNLPRREFERAVLPLNGAKGLRNDAVRMERITVLFVIMAMETRSTHKATHTRNALRLDRVKRRRHVAPLRCALLDLIMFLYADKSFPDVNLPILLRKRPVLNRVRSLRD